MKKNLTHFIMGMGMIGSAMAQTITTGPSATQSPYVLPITPGYSITSILNAGTAVGNYTMPGLPDGMGAFDNNDGTFTLLMNHEFGSATTGAVHAFGSAGAYVSKWIINKTTLAVVSGADLTQHVHLWNPASSTYSIYNAANSSTLAGMGRFCSADLAAVSAYYNSATGKGTQERIFMDGEETGNEGRMMAHVATGPNAGHSYELPFLGKFSCENQVANPYRSDKTIVVGFDDTTPGQVYVYVGNKTSAGDEITRAGLTNGILYGVAVSGLLNETSASIPAANTTFSLINLGAIQAVTGTSLNTISNNLGVTSFLRPEDGAWDPMNPRDLYFNTTNAFNSPSRLWRLRFTDLNNPQLGGTITAVLDGTEGQQMLDNLTIDNSGHILLNEDVGGNAYLGRILEYNIATDVLTPIAEHDATRFITGAPNFLTQDEEASGIVDVQAILGPGKFLFVSQAHYAINSPVVEGGQLMMLSSAKTASSNPEVNIQGNTTNIPSGNTAITVGDNTSFGLSNIGTPVTRSFLIQNTGTGALVISGMNMTGTNAGDFIFVTPPTFPLTIAANGSQAFTVQFNPALLGNRSATVNVYNNDLNENIYDFAIQGVGAAPEINLEGNSITIIAGATTANASNNTDFGSVIYNTPVTKTFNIQNTGNGTLTVSGIALAGANANVFSLTALPAFPLTLAGNASQTFAVQFLAATAPGTNVAKVVITNTDADESSYDFAIEGKSLIDVGITTLSKSGSFVSLYPNPAKDEATLKMNLENNGRVVVTVFDIQGKLVMTAFDKDLVKGDKEISLNTTSLKNGEYFVLVTSGNKTNKIKMVVIH